MSGRKTFPPFTAVVIPSLEPPKTIIPLVIELIGAEAYRVIIVNDGSPASYSEIFEELGLLENCVVLSHEKNLGKGAALRTGLLYCSENLPECRVAVTVDGDGHHRVCDAVSCAHRSNDFSSVVLGMRRKGDPTILKRARYGNAVTSALVSVVCDFDEKITDPLTGLRGFPSKYIPDICSVPGDGYDFETNMLLEISRNKIPLRTFLRVGTPVNGDKTHSHFRPFRDTCRIIYELIRYYSRELAFALSSLLCYTLEYLIYRLFLGYVPGMPVSAANLSSRLIAGAINFTINRKIVFRAKNGVLSSTVKYFINAFFILTTSTLLIIFFNRIFPTASNTVAKYVKLPIDSALFFLSFYIQKKWVFRSRD
ncbi:MAG: bifunctional glycosyltransferase family 2/GtrA family protein [Clostridia bacterium]|nr:bifunctional glycosyltransferase family 2/GtrA family protein [Clostridia bacterium]